MIMYRNVSDLISDICLDERVENGIFDMFNNEHLHILREKLEEFGFSGEESIEMANKVIEGKYPERQAYNRKGILVTFPTPEYKAAAIKRGTHFEENPTKGQSNLDFGDQPAPAQPVTEPVPQVEPASAQSVATQTPTAPSTPTTPTEPAKVDDLRTRPPEQIKKDAVDVQKILTTEFTLEEANKHGWIKSEKSAWYDSDGNFKGYEWYCIDSKQKKILSSQ